MLTMTITAHEKEELASRLKEGTFNLDCSEIRLTQDIATDPCVFRGPGYIRQNDAGDLTFKLYLDGEIPNETEDLGTPGEIIAPEKFYTFVAFDMLGNEWTGNRILPHISRNHSEGRLTLIVEGTVRLLTINTTNPYTLATNTLRLQYATDAAIPCHSSTVLETTIANQRTLTSSTLNLATFNSCGYEFLATQLSDEIVLEAWSTAPFHEHIETRLTEALQFILARPLQWHAMHKEIGREHTFQIRSTLQQSRSRLLPPINLHIPAARYWAWVLFSDYLQFIIDHSNSDWHPCSIHLANICEASAGSLDADILATSVAAEGITKTLYPNIATVQDNFIRAVDDLKAAVNNWLDEHHPADEFRLKSRVHGLLGNLTGVRAIDRLEQLQECGVIERKHIKAWKSLRNSAAHAEPGTREWQLLLDRRDLVVILIYRLVFHAIGYEGCFSDYGSRSWPIRTIAHRPATEQVEADGRIICQTRAFGRHLEWSGFENGQWTWFFEGNGSGTAPNKVQAERSARSFAERATIDSVIRRQI
jgi:hypothetical protein